MRMVLVLLAAVMLGGCLHIDVHKHEESSTTTSTSEKVEVQDN